MRRTFALTLILTSYYLLLTPIVSAQSVDLLWQGEGYTPPFYQGRSLWSTESLIRFYALPNGLGNRNNLNYRWSKNGTILGSLSGVGKNSLTLSDTILSKSLSVRVEILNASQETIASEILEIAPSQTKALIYEDSPLYGLMLHKLITGTISLNQEEIRLQAFPFNFNTSSFDDNKIVYAWNNSGGGKEAGSSVLYRTLSDTSGSARINLSITNTEKITQSARNVFLINF